jgi:hypothetical protein
VRSHRFWLWFSAVVVAAIGIPAGLESLRILYHRRGLTVLHDAVWNNKPAPNGESNYEWYEYHKRELVARGEISQRHFVMPNLQMRTREYWHFVQMIMQGNHPPCIEWTSPSQRVPNVFRCKIWCENSDLAAWEAFNARYDVPNYWEIRDRSVKFDEEKYSSRLVASEAGRRSEF